MVERNLYINQIEEFIDKPFVKIITGIRRSGKSSVMAMLRSKLTSRGVSEDNILSLNFESLQYADILTAVKLYAYICERIKPDAKNYLLLDEIQEVENWEKCINSLMVDYDVDIYLTGSNSRMLSSDLATYLSGRYVEIPVYTISFSEFLQFRAAYMPEKNETQREAFVSYLRFGGFPVIHTSDYQIETAYKIVRDIYSSILLRDTVKRYNIRDIELLERVVRFIFDNVGHAFSGKKIADYFQSQQRKIEVNTVYNYLQALESAFIIFQAKRYDVKGREILKTQEKYYLGDVSLAYSLIGYHDRNIGGILENLVYLELKRRGYEVYVGKLFNREIDFIAEKQGDKLYVQVTYKLENDETVEREFSAFNGITDHYPKLVVSMDDFWQGSVDGVRHVHISDFLLNNNY